MTGTRLWACVDGKRTSNSQRHDELVLLQNPNPKRFSELHPNNHNTHNSQSISSPFCLLALAPLSLSIPFLYLSMNNHSSTTVFSPSYYRDHLQQLPFPAKVNLGVASLVVGSGLAGYSRHRTVINRRGPLLASLSLGGLYLTSSYLISNKRPMEGHLLASATGAVGFTTMAMWFIRNGRILPAGAICVASSLAIGYNQWKAIEL